MKTKPLVLLLVLLAATSAHAQGSEAMFELAAFALQAPQPLRSPEPPLPDFSSSRPQLDDPNIPASGFIQPVTPPPRHFDWNSAARQSFYFLSLEHGLRMVQRKTRRELGGRFWADYVASAGNVSGWGDGDGVFVNYVAHPM